MTAVTDDAASVEGVQDTLQAAGFLLPDTFTRGLWSRVCEGAAGSLLAHATATGLTPAEVLAQRLSTSDDDDTAAEAILRELGI